MKKIQFYSIASYGGLLAVVVEFLTVFYFYYKSPSDFSGLNPISYFASLQDTKLVFTLGFSAAAISFWVFIRYCLSRIFKTSLVLFGLASASMLMLAIVPYDPSSQSSDSLHLLMAQVFHASFVVGILLMAVWNDDKKLKVASYIVTAFNVLILVPFLIAREGSTLFLALELSIGLSNQIWILWVSYLGLQKAKPN